MAVTSWPVADALAALFLTRGMGGGKFVEVGADADADQSGGLALGTRLLKLQFPIEREQIVIAQRPRAPIDPGAGLRRDVTAHHARFMPGGCGSARNFDHFSVETGAES